MAADMAPGPARRTASDSLRARLGLWPRAWLRAWQKAGPHQVDRLCAANQQWPRVMEVPPPRPGPGTGENASARDLAGLDARGAGVHALRRPTDHGTHALDVRVPATRRTTVRV